MASKIFNATAIDKLINDSLMASDNLKEELTNINDSCELTFEDNSTEDDFLPDESKSWSQTKGVVNKTYGTSISFDYVYKKIGQLIDSGNATMQLLQSIDPDVTNPATLGATASLMNSIKGCIAEFTKIHQQYIKFQHSVELEKMRHEMKKDLIRFRKNVAEGKDVDGVKPTDLIEVKSTDLLDFMEMKKNKKGLNNGN